MFVRITGALIVLAVIGGLFAFAVYSAGIKIALIAWSTTVGVAGLILLGCWMAFGCPKLTTS